MKTTTNEMELLKKTVIIQQNIRKKKFSIICNQINRKIPDPSDTKEYHQFYMKKKKLLIERSKIIT